MKFKKGNFLKAYKSEIKWCHFWLYSGSVVAFEVVKAGPLEAILVIFGRRALIFFLFESSWKKWKNDTTFVSMRSGDHLGDAKNVEKGHLTPSNLTFLLMAVDTNGFCRMKEEG